MISQLFANWRFRTTRPVFTPGEEIRAYLTSVDPASGEGVVRIGDTVLVVKDAPAARLDELVSLRVESFDAQRSVGTARVRPHEG
ncbi:MAG: hypothetical protein ACNA8J_07510 [Gammaproteobacteria bacterium]